MKKEEAFLSALQTGANRYLSVVKCPTHGTVQRYTKNRGCIECAKNKAAAQYLRKIGRLDSFRLTAHADDRKAIEEFAQVLAEVRRCQK